MLVVSIYRRRFVVSSFPCPIVVLLLAVISFLAVLSFAGGHSNLVVFPCPGFVRFLGVGDVGLVLGI